MEEQAKVRELEIQALSNIVAEKRSLLTGLGMLNANVDEATRMRNSMAYSQAQADLWNAENDLRAVILKGA